jgi:hypothetical protein
MKLKRLILIMLLAILPIQMSWAGVSTYLHLAEGDLVQFVGEHAETTAAASVTDDANLKHDKVRTVDGGCCPHCHGLCHLSALPLTNALTVSFGLEPGLALHHSLRTAYQSHIPDGPLKPNWRTAS